MKSLNKNYVLLAVFLIWLTAPLLVSAGTRPSDDDIRFWVKDAISEDAHINTSGVVVAVVDGIVTLSGEVPDLAAKNYAVLEAKKVNGVLGVINNLTLAPSTLWDMDIAQTIRHRIVNSVAIESENITVTCLDGKVTLTGAVSSWSEKDEAGLLASEVRGVQSVQNDLIVNWRSSRSDDAIENDIRASIKRDVYLTDMRVNVSVQNGVATLSGTVRSEYQKSRAYNDARWINNVQILNNNIKVEWWENQEAPAKKTPYPTDKKLAIAVTEELQGDARIDPLDLVVTATSGHVTVKGSVANDYQKTLAEAHIRDVIGVGWVTNDLVVRSVKREDVSIRVDMVYDISTDEALWNQGIEVKVNDGVVSLSGSVDSVQDKVHATKVASQIHGVRDVRNLLTVDFKQGDKDGALLSRVEIRMLRNWLLSPVKDKIKVSVRKGVATLTGTVYNWGERREAERVAFNTNGIRMVDNRLQVEGYDYHWQDWYLTDPDDLHYPYYYPYGYYWDPYYLPLRKGSVPIPGV